MPEPKKHAESRGWIETILRKIPGFKGYLEKEYRRESDALQRTWLADRLQRSKRGLDRYAQALVETGRIDDLGQIERLRARLDKIIARIRGAMQGYSGMFDLVQIDEKVLDEVYEADVNLMQEVEGLAGAIESLGGSAGAPQATVTLPELLDKIEAIDQKWDYREDILKGLK